MNSAFLVLYECGPSYIGHLATVAMQLSRQNFSQQALELAAVARLVGKYPSWSINYIESMFLGGIVSDNFISTTSDPYILSVRAYDSQTYERLVEFYRDLRQLSGQPTAQPTPRRRLELLSGSS